MADEQKKILVVEDEPDQSDYLCTLLEDNGYSTESASDGNEALEKARKNPPDLVTLDMSMPEKSGIKFYREIKDDPKLAKIPVLVVTGVTGFGGNPGDFEKFLSTRKQVPPPDGFVPKPIDVEVFLKKINELIK